MSEAVLKHADFEPRIGEDFAIEAGGTVISLKLQETAKLGAALREGGAFALYFAGPLQPLLPQATYTLRNDALGALDIFIVPFARTTEGVRYEAIFT